MTEIGIIVMSHMIDSQIKINSTIGKCECINFDDKHELSKAVIARIELYRKSIREIETEEIIRKTETLKEGEIEISPKTTKKMSQYKGIIDRLEGLYERLKNTPICNTMK